MQTFTTRLKETFLEYLPGLIKFSLMCTFLTLAAVEPAAAQEFSGVTNFLNKIVEAITGPIGKAVAALAVIAVGFSFMTGRMDWTFAVAVVIGIAIVFGGATFVSNIAKS